MTMDVNVKVEDVISKPIAEVFQSIVNPEKLSAFFTSAPTPPLQPGHSITWEFEDAGRSEKVVITEVNFNEHIRFKWHASGTKTKVDICLAQKSLLATEITITEEGWEMDKAGVKAAMGQTQGWTDFICSLKAYLYCNIRLRNGNAISSGNESVLTAG